MTKQNDFTYIWDNSEKIRTKLDNNPVSAYVITFVIHLIQDVKVQGEDFFRAIRNNMPIKSFITSSEEPHSTSTKRKMVNELVLRAHKLYYENHPRAKKLSIRARKAHKKKEGK